MDNPPSLFCPNIRVLSLGWRKKTKWSDTQSQINPFLFHFWVVIPISGPLKKCPCPESYDTCNPMTLGEDTDMWKICQPGPFSDSRICKLECDFEADTVCTVYYDKCQSN